MLLPIGAKPIGPRKQPRNLNDVWREMSGFVEGGVALLVPALGIRH
jgi:hypothetical protein